MILNLFQRLKPDDSLRPGLRVAYAPGGITARGFGTIERSSPQWVWVRMDDGQERRVRHCSLFRVES